MRRRGALLYLTLLLLAPGGCSVLGPDSEEVLTFYVGPELVDCIGSHATLCMVVKEDLQDDWSYFHDPIEGFTHEQGFVQHLVVERRSVPDPPADGSSYAYRLLRVLGREPA